MKKQFQGDKKKGLSILGNLELKLRSKLVPLVPKNIQTYHLTLMTIL